MNKEVYSMKNKSIGRLILTTLILLILGTSVVWGLPHNYRGEIVSIFKDVEISKDTVTSGNVVALFGDITIRGIVEGDAVAVFGRIKVEGTVARDVVSVFGGITVAPGGSIERSATAVLGHGVINNGNINRDIINIMGFFPFGTSPMAMIIMLLLVLTVVKQMVAFIFSAIILHLFPEKFNMMATDIKNETGKKALIGILVYLGGFVLSTILIMTVIGAPLVLLIIPVILLLEFASNTTIKISVGRKIATVLGKNWTIMMELLIGSIVYTLLELSIIGKLITFVMKLIGLGELINSRFGEVPKKPIIHNVNLNSTKGDEQ